MLTFWPTLYILAVFILTGEAVDFLKDVTGVFEPSDEWKTVEPGKISFPVFLLTFYFYAKI